jgi:hypothetical protein
MLCGSLAAAASAAGPKIHIVLTAEAGPLEQFAAEELTGQFKKLFDAETSVSTESPADADNVILLGTSATFGKTTGLKSYLPELNGANCVVKSVKLDGRTRLVVAAGDPRGVLNGAYEVGWYFGIRYFDFGDLYPPSPKPFTLDGFDLDVHEGGAGDVALHAKFNLTSPVLWAAAGSEEQARYLGQLAKCRGFALKVSEPRDEVVEKIAALRLPVGGDTAGRSAFRGEKFFENPDVAGFADPAGRRRAAEQVLDRLDQTLKRLDIRRVELPVDAQARILPSLWEFYLVAGRRGPIYGEPTAERFAEVLTPVCGEEVSERVRKGFAEAAAARDKVAGTDEGFDVVDPQMLLRHYASDEPPPAWWGEVRTNYLNAMNEMYRANTRAREGGRAFTLWYARRFEFAMEYTNVVEALRKAGIAKRKGNKDEQIAELEKALDSLTGACNAIAATARSQSDRGIIAVMNEYGYRPVTKLLEEADAEN